MAIAFKLPEITSTGHYQPQTPPPPQPHNANHPVMAAAVVQPAVAPSSDVSVTDSVPRSVVLQQQPIIVPHTATTALVFHPIPPIFLVPHQHSPSVSPSPSPPPSPPSAYRPATVPRQTCPPAVGCATCRDIQRVSLLLSLVVLNLVL